MDAEKLRKLKDEAAKYLGKGRVDKALEIYAKVLESDPHDLQSRLKCGDLYRRLGKDAEAIACYHQVAEAYANEGLLLKAIAVCKLILEVDENHTATQSMLAGLYAKKSGSAKPAAAAAPAAKSADAAPPPPPLPIDMLDIAAPLEPMMVDVGDVVLEDMPEVDMPAVPAAPPPTEAREDLPQIPLFSDLSKNAFISLMERMKMRTAQTGEVIIQEGGKGDSFFIIAQGKVHVEKNADGKPLVLASLGDGAFFGEMALLSESPRTASVIVDEPTQLFEISKSVLDQVSKEYSSVQQVLLRFYKQRLLANLMATSRIFKLLTVDQRKKLIEQFKSREVPANEVILSEGQKGDGLYLILSGRVKILKLKGETKQVVVARLKEGEVFGEMSLLSNAPVSATVTAEKRSIILRLPRKSFAEVLSTHPQLLEHISQLSDERSKMTEAIVAGTVAVHEDDVMLV
ncbi:MAG: cyclic nucleotide-binding domain-containing protein [Deltaproteobacteria bacterium]|nr:cyclic nucleotide-binding domain-containing protein [Deltaproteobacteria bacterium]